MKKYDTIDIEFTGDLNLLKGLSFEIDIEDKYIDFVVSNEDLEYLEIKEE